MNPWYMLTVVGQDRPGIVARLTDVLYAGGCNLGEASMIRLGGNFTIMLMVQGALPPAQLEALMQPVVDALCLRLHIDPIDGALYQQREPPDVRITVHGADRAGIVARVTGALAEAGLDILDLASEVAGNEQKPIYVMYIDGYARRGVDALQAALATLSHDGFVARLEPIQTISC